MDKDLTYRYSISNVVAGMLQAAPTRAEGMRFTVVDYYLVYRRNELDAFP